MVSIAMEMWVMVTIATAHLKGTNALALLTTGTLTVKLETCAMIIMDTIAMANTWTEKPIGAWINLPSSGILTKIVDHRF